jgi:hypothetical protein
MTDAILQNDAALLDLLNRADAVQQANRQSQLRREQERRTLERIERTPLNGAV